MKTINSLLITAILLLTTIMSWTYFALRSEQATLPQVGIGGGPEVSPDVSVRTLVTERTILTVTHLTNLYDSLETANTSKNLAENTQKLGEQFGTGTDEAMARRILNSTIAEYELYTKALKENDSDNANLAKENLEMLSMDFGNLLHKLNPLVSKQKGTTIMNDQNTAILEVVTTHAKNDRLEKANAIERANNNSLRFADELSKQPTP